MELGELLAGQAPSVRAELADLAALFAEAERGARVVDRLVLSGHSGGWSIASNDGGIDFDAIRALARIFPHAAAGVRHIMISGCQTGYPQAAEEFRAAFPGLESFWAYDGTAPTAYAPADMVRWAALTGRGAASVDPAAAPSSRARESSATLSTCAPRLCASIQGYASKPLSPA